MIVFKLRVFTTIKRSSGARLPLVVRNMSSHTGRKVPHVRKVCIVGGGPSGVAAAKYLKAERHFTHIDVFEQRDTPGGVWDYHPDIDNLSRCPVPHLNPDVPPETPFWRRKSSVVPQSQNGRKDDGWIPAFQSPIYERLIANLPKMLMQHSDMAFPNECGLFPTHEDILEYTKRYARDVEDMIRYRTQVTSVRRQESYHGQRTNEDSTPVWSVTTRQLRPEQNASDGSETGNASEESTKEYDAVLIASGHYTVPFIPEYDGLREWSEQNPGAVSHSKYFKLPEDYTNKKVLVVGFGPSGIDISMQIAQHCKKPLLVSTRSPPMIPVSAVGGAESLPAVVSFLNSPSRSIRFADGTIVHDVDHVLFCTGYLYSYPCLPASPCAVVSEEYPLLPSQGARVHNLYQHIFHVPDPSLAFMGIPWNIVPFPVAEAQAAVIARVWSGKLAVPRESDMVKWERDRETEKGAGKIFHKLPVKPNLEDADYVNMLWSWAAESQTHESGDGTAGAGKEPPFWNARIRWMRENVWEMRKKFEMMRDAGQIPKTLEDVGFVWEDQKQ